MNIYFIEIFESHVSGFTTYKQELLSLLKNNKSIKLNIISLYCPIDEFYISVNEEVTFFHLPYIKCHTGNVIGTILKLFIEDTYNNTFIINFAPTYPTIVMLRKNFPKCKIINVIHDLMWANFLMGDVNRFKRIIRNEDSYVNKDLIKAIYYDEINAYMNSDINICLSKDTFKLLNEFYNIPLSKLIIIPNGLRDVKCNIDLQKARKFYGISQTDKILLYVGRICLQKGIIDVINNFDIVLKSVPNCKLVIAGAIDNKLIGTIKSLYGKNIIILGSIAKQDLYKWYCIADIGLMPSYYEQCSYSGIEMKMFGLPIIASNGFGIKQMFNSENSIIVNIGNRNKKNEYGINLTESIIKTLTMPHETLNILSIKSRKHYETTFNDEQMLKKYLNLLYTI